MIVRNYAEACELQAIIRAKKDRLDAIQREVRKINSRVKGMTDKQLEEAVRDVAGMHREERELKAYITKAKAAVNAYFAPATVVA